MIESINILINLFIKFIAEIFNLEIIGVPLWSCLFTIQIILFGFEVFYKWANVYKE